MFKSKKQKHTFIGVPKEDIKLEKFIYDMEPKEIPKYYSAKQTKYVMMKYAIPTLQHKNNELKNRMNKLKRLSKGRMQIISEQRKLSSYYKKLIASPKVAKPKSGKTKIKYINTLTDIQKEWVKKNEERIRAATLNTNINPQATAKAAFLRVYCLDIDISLSHYLVLIAASQYNEFTTDDIRMYCLTGKRANVSLAILEEKGWIIKNVAYFHAKQIINSVLTEEGKREIQRFERKFRESVKQIHKSRD